MCGILCKKGYCYAGKLPNKVFLKMINYALNT